MRALPLIDHRDPVGQERYVPGRHTELEREHGRLCVPWSLSGRCLRNPQAAADFEAEGRAEAERRYAEWRDCPPNQPTPHGGSVLYRPVLLVLSNYGIGLYCAEADRRVRPFGPMEG